MIALVRMQAHSRGGNPGITAVAIVLLVAVVALPAYPQTEKVLHNFGGPGDGYGSESGPTFDAAGNLYGTSPQGGGGCGLFGCGVVYQLVPNGNGTWVESVIHRFNGNDGAAPYTAVIFDARGNLYGTTARRGTGNNGSVFELSRGGWTETVLHSFTGQDGAEPDGALAIDSIGRLYGTTVGGGAYGYGVVYRLDRGATGWRELTLFSFGATPGGLYPSGPLAIDSQGNLYGTTGRSTGVQGGAVYELVSHGAFWTEKVLYEFTGGDDGDEPYSGVTFDQAGNLYGTTAAGGPANQGVVFMLHPNANGTWTESTLYAFLSPSDGGNPLGGLTIDAQGNLYGTTSAGGSGRWGTVFKLTGFAGNNSWTKTVLWNFSGGADGGQPWGNVILDRAGNIYGTTNYGGQRIVPCQQYGCGVVYELTP
jgi:uncharacterized repeat protein (TIGR03803 family)